MASDQDLCSDSLLFNHASNAFESVGHLKIQDKYNLVVVVVDYS